MGDECAKNKDRLQEEEEDVEQRLEYEEKRNQDYVEKPVDWQYDPVEDSKSPGEIYVHLETFCTTSIEVNCRVFLLRVDASLLV